MDGKVDLGTLFHIAKEHGYKPERKSKSTKVKRIKTMTKDNADASSTIAQVTTLKAPDDTLDLTPPEAEGDPTVAYSQDEIAKAFTLVNSHRFRYVAKWERWYFYTGTNWQQEDTYLIWDLIRKACRKFAAHAVGLTEPQQRKIVDASTIVGIKKLVRAAREHAAVIHQWDSDPWLLNTPEGFIDLRTGSFHAHRSDLYMTKMARVTPKEIPTPLWDKFLNRVQPDKNVQDYLNRRTGYGLTGSIREHALFFDYGTGRNGKGVFQQVQLEIMGSYATTAPMELIAESKYDRHPTEIARLHQARAVGLSETDKGRRWDEAKIKMMTGGDVLQGRFMRQDFFEFMPEFKLYILGNHMPALRNVDEAISSRLQVVGWLVFLPVEERDKQLIEKLRPEYPGIFHRWIQGCLDWQKDGLNPPQSVDKTTKDYLHSEDALGRWIEENTKKEQNGFSTNEQLFTAWCQWCESQREYAGKMTSFTQNLEKRGFERGTQHNKRGFRGIVIHNIEKLERIPDAITDRAECARQLLLLSPENNSMDESSIEEFEDGLIE
jgi:putative DNA primase/helicase